MSEKKVCQVCENEVEKLFDYGNSKICESCMSDIDVTLCNRCGTAHYYNSLTRTPNGSYICESCVEEHYFICDHCESMFPRALMETLDNLNIHVCTSCRRGNYIKCNDCGDWVSNEDHDYTWISGGEYYICESCLDDSYQQCYDCNDWFEVDNTTWLDIEERSVCDGCREYNYRYCEICNEWIQRSEVFSMADGEYVCNDCYDHDGYICCDGCGVAFIPDDDESYCPPCNEEFVCEECGIELRRSNRHRIHNQDYCYNCYTANVNCICSYSYKPNPKFFGDGPLWMGIELEIDGGGESGAKAKQLKQIGGDHIYIKHDGSLSNGFEIITHPMSMDYHMNKFPWESLLKKCLELGYRSHNPGTCGLHIHVNKNYFGDWDTWDEKIANILCLMENNADDMQKLSRRQTGRTRYCERYFRQPEETPKQLLDKAKYADRYRTINILNDKTVEFRLWRGTLNWNSFKATMQLTMIICILAEQCTANEIESMNIADVIYHAQSYGYDTLVEYAIDRGVVTKDQISDIESKNMNFEEVM